MWGVCLKLTILQLGNDRGMGNTMCFWPAVHWGMGVVLRFDTHTLTITLRGFYVVFGHTPDGLEAQNSNLYHTHPLIQCYPLSTSTPPALATP